jgi:hypothetical protein
MATLLKVNPTHPATGFDKWLPGPSWQVPGVAGAIRLV